jgi:hypothetical protein
MDAQFLGECSDCKMMVLRLALHVDSYVNCKTGNITSSDKLPIEQDLMEIPVWCLILQLHELFCVQEMSQS